MQLITVNQVIDQLLNMSESSVVSPSAEEHVYLSDLSSKEITVGEALERLAQYELDTPAELVCKDNGLIHVRVRGSDALDWMRFMIRDMAMLSAEASYVSPETAIQKLSAVSLTTAVYPTPSQTANDLFDQKTTVSNVIQVLKTQIGKADTYVSIEVDIYGKLHVRNGW